MFRSLAQDPWNKLKLYLCLRVIERIPSPGKRARLLVELANVRKAFDPAVALDLAEAAIRTAPTDAAVQAQIDSMIKPWLPKFGAKPVEDAPLEIRNLLDQRQAMVAQIKAQLGKSGVDGYVCQLLKSQAVPENLIAESVGFQTNWTGMVQFIDYLKTKKGLTESQYADILDDMEQTLVLIEPQNPAVERLRALRGANSRPF